MHPPFVAAEGASVQRGAAGSQYARPDGGMSGSGRGNAERIAQESAAAMWAADVASRRLGMELDEVRPGYARVRMTVTHAMINGHDLCHGGYVFTLADTAFAFACNTHGKTTLAAACDVVFVAPVRLGETLVAEATERTRYGRSGVYDVTVRRGTTVVAEMRGQSRTVER
jgi:acyl-CoA thioesterase